MKHSASSRASAASGIAVMPMMVAPLRWYSADSARVEKRGPLITTRVPPSVSSVPVPAAARPAAARPVGQYGSAKDRWATPWSPSL